MNHRPSSSQLLNKAITGFLNFKTAEGMADRTIDSYDKTLNRWLAYTGEVAVPKITSQKISQYLIWLRTEYVPQRFNGKTHPLSPKTLRNVWVVLSSFFTWACREFKFPNPMKEIPAPKFQRTPVEPFTQLEVEHMLKACIYSRESDTTDRKKFVMRRPTANRDQAVLITLLDTGLRASELCALKIGDLDQKRGKLDVRHGVEGGAKGGKGRTVFLGKVARHAVWRYLAEREDGEDPEAPLFIVNMGRQLNKDVLRRLIERIGERAGVKNAYPHKFRHTFAIMYLRSGGDVFTLQILLGHGSLDMVRYYAQIAQVDVEQAHRKASPADHWRL